MIRDLIRKVASKTPGLRSVRNWERRAAPKSAPVATPTPSRSSGPLPAREHPHRVEPESSRSGAPPAEARAPSAPAEARAPAAPAPPVAAGPETPTTAPAPSPQPASEASPNRRGGGRGAQAAEGGNTKAASRTRKSAPADNGAADRKATKARAPARAPTRDEEAVEALRLEAEQRKAEIRARKEAEARAAAPVPAVGGIAALIAQSGGQVDQIAAGAGTVKAVNVWVPDDTEIHVAEDGVEYWGSVDNESARAYARGETLVIDQWECINCGTCVENTDHVFVLPMDAKAVVISQEGPMDLIQDAIDACPVTCIHWTDNPDQYEQLNDAEGNPLH